MAGWVDEILFESSEGYSTGFLSGQGGWGVNSKPADFSIVNTVAAQGTQSLSSGAIAGGDRGGNSKTVSTVNTDGSLVYISLRTDNNTSVDSGGMEFKGSGAFIFYLWQGFPNANSVALASSLGNVEITTVNTNTWYRFGIEFDFTNDRVRGNVDNGTMSAWRTCDAFSQIDEIKTNANNGDGGSKTIFMDWVSPNYSDNPVVSAVYSQNNLPLLGVS